MLEFFNLAIKLKKTNDYITIVLTLLSSIFPTFDTGALPKTDLGALVDKKLNGIHELHAWTVPCSVLGPQYKRDITVREWVWKSITRMVRLPEHMTPKERLTRLVLFTVKKRRACGGSFCTLQLPRGAFRQKIDVYERARGEHHKLKQGKFWLGIWIKAFGTSL